MSRLPRFLPAAALFLLACPAEVLPPVAAIGPAPDGIAVGSLVTLDGSASADTNAPPLDLLYQWAFLAQPPGSRTELLGDTLIATSFTPDLPGDYVVTLVVWNGSLASDRAETTVTVSTCGAGVPVVDSAAPAPEFPNTYDRVVLGVEVSDIDNDPVQCALTQTLDVTTQFLSRPVGSSAALAPAEGLAPSFVGDVPGDYTLRTTVTDDTGRSSAIETIVTVSECGSAPPFVAAATPSPQALNAGDLVSLSLDVQDADNDPSGCALSQTIEAATELISVPVGSQALMAPGFGVNPAFVADVPGDYVLLVTATDETGASSTQEVALTVSTCGTAPPTIDSVVPAPLAPNAGDRVSLTVAATDADNDPLGCALAQSLTASSAIVLRPPGSDATVDNVGSFTPNFVADLPGDYIVRTTVWDDTGVASSVDTTVTASVCGTAIPTVDSVTASPLAPNAGDEVGFLVAFSDADNDPLGCALTQTLELDSALVQQPAGSAATVGSASSGAPWITTDLPGDYVLRTTVSDATGRSSFVDTPVTVSTCGSASPTVTATASPASPNTGGLVALSLTIADADNAPGCALGQTLSASTGFIQRPAGSAAAMAPAEGLTPGFIAANPGTYVLRSTVTDSTGRFATVDTSVTVSSCGAAQPSITGVTVTPATPHPGNAVQLAVAATDADNNAPCSQNQTLTYATTIIAQPAGSNVTLVPAAGPNTQFTPTLVGTYVLRTIVTDTTTRNSAINTTVVVTP